MIAHGAHRAGAGPGHARRRSCAAEPAKPLFASNELIRLTISGPISAIASKAEQSEAPRAATLALAGTARYPSDPAVGARDHPAQERCLPIPAAAHRFRGSPPAATSLFHGQKRLKLVTHCRQSPGFQQYVLLEYAAYRLFNVLTPASFRVRLATGRLCRCRAASRRLAGRLLHRGHRRRSRGATACAKPKMRDRIPDRAAQRARRGAGRRVRIYDRQSRLVDRGPARQARDAAIIRG